jgi:hypothetical protein
MILDNINDIEKYNIDKFVDSLSKKLKNKPVYLVYEFRLTFGLFLTI